MTRRTKENIGKSIAAAAGIIITFACILMAVGEKNKALNDAIAKQSIIEKKVNEHDRAITTIETKIDYISRGIDEIKVEVKKGK